MLAALDLAFDPNIDFWLLLAVPLIPFVGYLLQIAFRKRWPWGDVALTGGMFVAMCITVLMAAKAIYAAKHGLPFAWSSKDFGIQFEWLYSNERVGRTVQNIVAGVYFDSLGAAMLAVVGIVSFCVHLFSRGYMHGDRRYNIFFANISLFTFAMLGLVLSDNILFLFVFWEIMGLMSYLLIGHFAHDPSQPFFHRWATWASKKAFLTTRIGDVCLLLGFIMFYREWGTLEFTGMWEAARLTVAENGGEYPAWMTVAGLFVFGGTVGKSAQFPLHLWLPDAMAGPTPVSAMIHAATMVAAGVMLLGRMFPLFSPEVLATITFIGAFTAIGAATIGLTAYDLKAVLAYSTISQLGFMVAAVGCGAVVAGMFHMVTHAFFKACLFLSAGSVIHGCHHEQDMRRMGGLRKRMPVTFWCMTLCTAAIAGVPLFSGFYSKDLILQGAWAGVVDRSHFSGWSLFALLSLALAAAMTSFYMFRLVFMTFFNEYRGDQEHHMYSEALAAEAAAGIVGPGHAHAAHDDHGHDDHGHDDHGHDAHASHGPHESPATMTIPLMILAFFGVFGGCFWLLQLTHLPGHSYFLDLVTFERLYGPAVGTWMVSTVSEAISDPHGSHLGHLTHNLALVVSTIVMLSGLVGAWYLYVKRRDIPAKIAGSLGLVYDTVRGKYFYDEFIDATVIRGTMALAYTQKWFDEKIIDGLVLSVGRVNLMAGGFWAWFDRTFVDGLVNLTGLVSQLCGSAMRLLQTGRIQQYAAFAVGGGLLTAAWLILA
ncbi:MAG: NADH-quinone oxidoreductase subunit L [Planctomycetota bacterium]